MTKQFIAQRKVFQETKKKSEDAATVMGASADGKSRSLYAEMSIMSELSALVYTVAYLIGVVGEGGYPTSKKRWWWSPEPELKQLEKTDLVIDQSDDTTKAKSNIPAATVLAFIDANADALVLDPEIVGEAEEGEIHPRSELVLRALDNIEQYQDGNSLWAFDHRFEGTGLVYGITVNRTLQRVTVVFRGSVTGEDWWQNSQVTMTDLKTPGILRDAGFGETIKVHGGFKDYLLDEDIEKQSFTAQQMDETKPPKYGRILRDLEACFNYEENGKKVHEGFHLYVTGHSLGGALSQLLAFKLASSHFITQRVKHAKPVINISVASPYLGNQAYANAVKELETRNLLRHVRVTNFQDVVPVAPPKRFLYGAVYEPYVHTGLNVHLKPGKGNYEMGFGLIRSFYSQVAFSSGDRHAVSDYWGRQNEDQAGFSEHSIDEFYSKCAAEEAKPAEEDKTES